MRNILFIITGSIAASKCEEIIKLLVSKNFNISCIITNEAKKYIKLNALRKVTKNKLFTDSSEKNNKMLHINLSRENDIIFVCPASANTIAKFANGYCDNLASNTLLASNKKIIFAPAMNSQMWLNKANQTNIKNIKKRGYEFIGPEIGNLKCGEFGIGRISNTNKILERINNAFNKFLLLKNKKCLVTAGPTIEMIDPVRFISNESSGKQGYEIASQLAINGAKVILISGPTNIDPPANVKLFKVKSTYEMYKKIKTFSNIDFGFFSAAICDYKSKETYKKKVKKKQLLKLNLIKNIDILEKIGNSKSIRPKILIGFAAETGNITFAKEKLRKKKCDIIVYNKISKNNNVFGSDFNKVSIVTESEIKHFKKMTKTNCAKEIINYIYKFNIENE